MQNSILQIICFKKIGNVCRVKHLACSWNHRDNYTFAKQGNSRNKVSLETKVAKCSLVCSCKVSILLLRNKDCVLGKERYIFQENSIGANQVLLYRETDGNDKELATICRATVHQYL
jgi:hypothetical protein